MHTLFVRAPLGHKIHARLPQSVLPPSLIKQV